MSIRAAGVTKGSFVEAREVIAGFYLLEAPSMDVAMAIAGQNTAIAAGGGVEVAPSTAVVGWTNASSDEREKTRLRVEGGTFTPDELL